jgi:uncharacterized protein YdbL (DUF1318 family)
MPGVRHLLAWLGLAGLVAACVPVTVNISFPQEKLDLAARQIEERSVAAGTPPAPSASPAAPGGSQTEVRTTIQTRTPEVVKASESRRQRRPALREWKDRGCIGETNQGLVVARPGDGCTPLVADLIRAENADRQLIYDAFMKENKIPASDTPRVEKAFAKARQGHSRPNDWVQLDDGQWVRKP